MKRATKAAAVAVAAPLVAVPLALGGTPVASAASATVVSDVSGVQLGPTNPGTTVFTHGPTPWSMADNLGGVVCATSATCSEVFYYWVVSIGTFEMGVDNNVKTLSFALEHNSGEKIVYGFSGGARTASKWLENHAGQALTAEDPDPSNTSFVLIGNGGRKYGGSSAILLGDRMTTPDTTPYKVVDVARQYDPVADFPDKWWNLLAVSNALYGFLDIHMKYSDVDLDAPDNVVWKEGNTTYVFVPTKNLPIVQPLRNLGLNAWADSLQEQWRPLIESAYNRPYTNADGHQNTLGAKTVAELLGSQETADQNTGDQLAALASKVSQSQITAAAPAPAADPVVSDNAPKSAKFAAAPEPAAPEPAAETEAGTGTVETKDAVQTKDAAETKDAVAARSSVESKAGADTTDQADTGAAPRHRLGNKQKPATNPTSASADTDGGSAGAAASDSTGPKHRAPLRSKAKAAASSADAGAGADADGAAGKDKSAA